MTTKTREELLEAALRIALRKLGGTLYIMSHDELEQRPSEGPLVLVDKSDPANHNQPLAELPGVLTPEELVGILSAIDDGEDPIVQPGDWRDTLVVIKTMAGHVVEVFNDCDDWDYVDSITHADGRRWTYADGCMAEARLLDNPCQWEPQNMAIWRPGRRWWRP